MPPAKYPKDLQEFERLVGVKSYDELAEFYSASKSAIYNWCLRFGLTPPTQRHHRTHKLNTRFFRVIDTPDKAYILGFIAADGSVNGNRAVNIALHPQDQDILIQIRACLGSTTPLYEQPQTARSYKPDSMLLRMSFCSKAMVADLLTHGITNNKSLTVAYPTTIPDELDRHFIRGYWDGNGTIWNKRFECSSGSKAMLQGIQKTILRHTGHELTPRKWYGFWRLIGYRKHQTALQWLYQNSTLHLSRKYLAFLEHWH
jgi:hypothetical protein